MLFCNLYIPLNNLQNFSFTSTCAITTFVYVCCVVLGCVLLTSIFFWPFPRTFYQALETCCWPFGEEVYVSDVTKLVYVMKNNPTVLCILLKNSKHIADIFMNSCEMRPLLSMCSWDLCDEDPNPYPKSCHLPHPHQRAATLKHTPLHHN